MKLIDCDSTDMKSWACSPMAGNFVRELEDMRSKAMRELVSKTSERCAGSYQAFDKILEMFYAAQRGK